MYSSATKDLILKNETVLFGFQTFDLEMKVVPKIQTKIQ